jgi:hypothetical protein
MKYIEHVYVVYKIYRVVINRMKNLYGFMNIIKFIDYLEIVY